MMWCVRRVFPGCNTLVASTLGLCGVPVFLIGPANAVVQSADRIQQSQLILAQLSLPDPNRERFQQPQPQPLPPDPDGVEKILPTPDINQPPSGQPDAEILIPVTRIDVTGSTIFGPAELDPITQPLEGRSVTLAELKEAAQKITQLYLAEGYITSRAVVSPQEITDGVVTIKVIEGSLQTIEINGTRRLNRRYIRRRLSLGVDTPFNANELEDQLQLLQANPLLDSIGATLQAGEGAGQSQLIVDVAEADSIILGLNIDNYTTPTTGPVRAGITLGQRNLTGNGDSFVVSYNTSTSLGLNVIDTSYTLPVNAKDGTLQLRAIIDRNTITESPFDDIGFESDSERYSLSFRQPLIRSPRQEFALSLGLSHQRSQSFLDRTGFPVSAGPDANGVSRTTVLQLGQDYTHRDPKGVWAFRSQFNIGLPIFDATDNEGSVPDGQFFSWLAQGQRIQRLSKNNLLIMQADLQLSPDSLLSSEQFVIGGAQSVRGYRQNALSGDNGFRFSVEDRIALARNKKDNPVFQIAPFLDLGYVFNSDNNPNRIVGNQFLIGLGLGLLWEPVPGLNIRLDYAPPLVDLDRGNDIQDNGFYFSINYRY